MKNNKEKKNLSRTENIKSDLGTILKYIKSEHLHIIVNTLNNNELKGEIMDFNKDIIILKNDYSQLYCLISSISHFEILEESNFKSKEDFYINENKVSYVERNSKDGLDNKTKSNIDDVEWLNLKEHLYLSL